MWHRLLFCLSSLIYSNLYSQINFEQYRLPIQKTNEKIIIDGDLNELIWTQTQVADDFFMITPVDTGKANQLSEARVTYDDENIYLAIIFYNTAVKGKYVVESLKRDFSFGKNDNFLVAIDPFNNQTSGFAFGLNAYGAQWDGTMYEGRSVDLNWDSKWYSAVQLDEEKWVCEIAIPFKSIRFDDENTVWGINFSRLDLKASEKSSWAPVPRQFPSVSLAYAGALVWDAPPPKQGNNSSLIPYFSNRIVQENQSNAQNQFKVGGDVKFNLTSSLNIDLTVNPDFSQAEVDQQVTNLDRFELFFPERRQFFLENADLFSNFGYSTIRPFFSRRIGLEVPIDAGVRLSGNLNENWRIGVMDIQTHADEDQQISTQNFGVFSLQRKVLDRSNINFIFVNKQDVNENNRSNSTSPYNRNGGIEFNYFSKDNLWDGKLLFLKSFSALKEAQGNTFASHFGYQSTRWKWRIQQEYVSGDYSADVGFVPRKNYHKLQALAAHLFYTADETISLLSHGPSVERIYFFDTDRDKKDLSNHFKYLFNFKNRSQFSLGIQRQFIELLRNFDPLRNQIATLKAGTQHEWITYTAAYNAKPQNRFTYSLEALSGGYYQEGTRTAFSGEFGYRFQPYLELNSLLNFNHIDLPQPWDTTEFWLLGFKANITFTNTLFFSNLYQYNEQLGLWNFNSRLQWRYKPASDLFIVFNSNEMQLPQLSSGWNLTFKLNYWLNL